jgi:hypothetical protein
MASEYYSDDNGNRVLIRHKGPAGPGVPAGGTTGQIYVKASNDDYDGTWANSPAGTGAAVGPASATANAFALFDGTTGKLLKDSTYTVSYFATKSYADTKVDKVTGKGLSEADFTTAEKTKLGLLTVEHFQGVFPDFATLEAEVGAEGAYAVVEALGDPLAFYAWDETNSEWADVTKNDGMTSAEIAAALFSGDDVYDQATTRIFNTFDRATLDGAASLTYVNSALAAAGLGVVCIAETSYFNLTGTAVAVAAISDGTTNLVKASVVTTLGSGNVSFDGGSSDARLRYTVASVRVMRVEARVAFSGTHNDTVVLGIAKNGSVIAASKTLSVAQASNKTTSVTISAMVSMTANDYVEVYVGNVTAANAVQVHSLYISAITA